MFFLKNKQGFTLIELIVVVVILGLLATIVAPKFLDKPSQAKRIVAKTNIESIKSALELYKLDNGVYPTTNQGLDALVIKPTGVDNWKAGGYISKLPTDPWGRDFQYLQPGENGAYDIFSYGLDNQEGGTDENADIVSW